MPLFEAHLPVLCNITYSAIILPPVMWPLQVVLINDSFLIASHWVEGKWMNHYLGSCMSDQSSLFFFFILQKLLVVVEFYKATISCHQYFECSVVFLWIPFKSVKHKQTLVSLFPLKGPECLWYSGVWRSA